MAILNIPVSDVVGSVGYSALINLFSKSGPSEIPTVSTTEKKFSIETGVVVGLGVGVALGVGLVIGVTKEIKRGSK